MFYFFEFFFRIFYFFTTFILVFLLIFLNKNYIFFILITKNILNLLQNDFYLETYFLLNSPTHLFETEIVFCVFLTIVFLAPHLIYNIYLFIEKSLNLNEKIKGTSFLLFYILYFYLFNLLLLFWFIPFFWFFLESLNNYTLNNSGLNIEYEPSIISYFNSIYKILFNFNLYFILFYFIFFLFKKLSFRVILQNYKLYFSYAIFSLFFLFICTTQLTVYVLLPTLVIIYAYLVGKIIYIFSLFQENQF